MLLVCDECGIQFDKKWMGVKPREQTVHFCSNSCSATRKNRGYWSRDGVREKQSAVIKAIHADPEIQARITAGLRAALGDRYRPPREFTCAHCSTVFVRSPSGMRPDVTERYCSMRCVALGTSKKNWTEERRETAKSVTRERNAVRWSDPAAHARQSAAVAKTHLDIELKARRGAAISATLSTPEMRAKKRAIGIALTARILNTRKRGGSFASSKGERDVVRHLVLLLGVMSVVHQPPCVDRFDIDVRVIDPPLYIQFDGIYHHGLDVPYERLEPKRKEKFDRDRAADAWFAAHSIPLIRILDSEWTALRTDEAKRRFLIERLAITT